MRLVTTENSKRNLYQEISDELFNYISHGDEEHRQWLKDELDFFFNHSDWCVQKLEEGDE
jgi:bacterioferritin (cytochrome b1)